MAVKLNRYLEQYIRVSRRHRYKMPEGKIWESRVAFATREQA